MQGTFLILGEARSGKTILLDHLKGDYKPNVDHVHHISSSSPLASTLPSDHTTRKHIIEIPIKTVPSLSQRRCFRKGNTTLSLKSTVEVEFHMNEIPTVKGGKHLDSLTEALVEDTLSRSQEQQQKQGDGFLFLQGIPHTNTICGLIWMIRGNCLLLNTSLITSCILKNVKEWISRDKVLIEPGQFNAPLSWKITSDFLEYCKVGLTGLYKNEMTIYARDTHNSIASMITLPSFKGLPLLLVYNTTQTILASDLAIMVTYLLQMIQTIMAEHMTAIRTTTTATTTSTTSPEYVSLVETLQNLIRIAVSLKPSEAGVLKIFQMEDLLTYFPLHGRYPSGRQVRMQWFLNGALMECVRKNLPFSENYKQLQEEPEEPCLIVPYLKDEKNSKQLNKRKENSSKVYPWWATEESYFVEQQELYQLKHALRIEKEKESGVLTTTQMLEAEDLDNTVINTFTSVIKAPDYVTVCFTSLGDENTEEHCMSTHCRQQLCQSGNTTTTTEGFISNWMSKAVVFHHELDLTKSVFFEHYYHTK